MCEELPKLASIQSGSFKGHATYVSESRAGLLMTFCRWAAGLVLPRLHPFRLSHTNRFSMSIDAGSILALKEA